jgi:hypothetical protein
LFGHGEKQVATLRCAEQRMASIATAGNKVQVSGAVKTLGLVVHGSRIEPRSSACGDATHHPTVMKAGSGENPFLERREKGSPPMFLVSQNNVKVTLPTVIGASAADAKCLSGHIPTSSLLRE